MNTTLKILDTLVFLIFIGFATAGKEPLYYLGAIWAVVALFAHIENDINKDED